MSKPAAEELTLGQAAANLAESVGEAITGTNVPREDGMGIELTTMSSSAREAVISEPAVEATTRLGGVDTGIGINQGTVAARRAAFEGGGAAVSEPTPARAATSPGISAANLDDDLFGGDDNGNIFSAENISKREAEMAERQKAQDERFAGKGLFGDDLEPEASTPSPAEATASTAAVEAAAEVDPYADDEFEELDEEAEVGVSAAYTAPDIGDEEYEDDFEEEEEIEASSEPSKPAINPLTSLEGAPDITAPRSTAEQRAAAAEMREGVAAIMENDGLDQVDARSMVAARVTEAEALGKEARERREAEAKARETDGADAPAKPTPGKVEIPVFGGEDERHEDAAREAVAARVAEAEALGAEARARREAEAKGIGGEDEHHEDVAREAVAARVAEAEALGAEARARREAEAKASETAVDDAPAKPTPGKVEIPDIFQGSKAPDLVLDGKRRGGLQIPAAFGGGFVPKTITGAAAAAAGDEEGRDTDRLAQGLSGAAAGLRQGGTSTPVREGGDSPAVTADSTPVREGGDTPSAPADSTPAREGGDAPSAPAASSPAQTVSDTATPLVSDSDQTPSENIWDKEPKSQDSLLDKKTLIQLAKITAAAVVAGATGPFGAIFALVALYVTRNMGVDSEDKSKAALLEAQAAANEATAKMLGASHDYVSAVSYSREREKDGSPEKPATKPKTEPKTDEPSVSEPTVSIAGVSAPAVSEPAIQRMDMEDFLEGSVSADSPVVSEPAIQRMSMGDFLEPSVSTDSPSLAAVDSTLEIGGSLPTVPELDEGEEREDEDAKDLGQEPGVTHEGDTASVTEGMEAALAEARGSGAAEGLSSVAIGDDSTTHTPTAAARVGDRGARE